MRVRAKGVAETTARACAYGALLLAMSASLAACAQAEWQKVEIDSPYRAPQLLPINVIAAPAQKEAARALSSSLADALQHGGITAVIVPPESGAAEANVTIARWGSESSARHELELDHDRGQITVTIDTATIGIEGTAYGWVNGGVFSGSASKAASAVGSLIGRTIVTGRRDGSVNRVPTRHTAWPIRQ